MKFFEALEGVLGKGLTRTLIIVACTAWVSFWFAAKIRDFERAMMKELAKIEQRNREQDDRAELRNREQDSRIELAWTVQMMAARDQIVSQWNPTNRIPDAWRIYHDVRAGREPIGVRIGP